MTDKVKYKNNDLKIIKTLNSFKTILRSERRCVFIIVRTRHILSAE